MFQLEVNDSFIVEQKQVLEQALSTNPKTQTALRKLIQKVIKEARDETVKNIHFENGDPRGTAHSVRRTVYKKILGANINIYDGRKAKGQGNSYEPPRHPSPRGGNRMVRSPRTNRMMHYPPHQRGMILRWVNDGTSDRYIGGRNGKTEAQRAAFILAHNGRGFRGSISSRNFFRGAGEPAMIQAVDHLANLIDTELYNILNKKKK